MYNMTEHYELCFVPIVQDIADNAYSSCMVMTYLCDSCLRFVECCDPDTSRQVEK